MVFGTVQIAIGVAVLLSAIILLFLARSRRREARHAEALQEAKEKNLHIPASLHPVIDPNVCIGSLSCLKSCPEGDILGVVNGAAVLIEAANCIGHGRCEVECPVNAIQLVFGTAHRGVDLPEVDEFFESSREGVHIVGELGGMGLIKNAITQGLQAANVIAARLKGRKHQGGGIDVAIVGAGPAGLATAVGLRQAGLSFQVLEQETVGGTIAAYPRQKVVMTEPVELPLYGRFGKKLISKEELLAAWQRVLRKAEIGIAEGVKVTGIDGKDGAFELDTSKGKISARKVVLAVGRRGSPRKMGVPGEELPKVTYRLIDPEQYEGTSVLVVGGGDSALEAAIALGEANGVEVGLSYRGEAFGKCREANKKKVAELSGQGRIKLMLPTQVKEVRARSVILEAAGQLVELPNDYVIVNIGGELPLEFLSKVGVDVKRHFGESRAKEVDAEVARAVKGSARPTESRVDRWLGRTLFVLGCLIIAALWVVGAHYYPLESAARLKSPLHKMLKPAGIWGHGVGIVATAFMLSNFLYPLRKRWRRLKGSGPIRRWLTFHVFVGFMSPLVIAFHAAFQSRNGLATGTTVALLVVVFTGLIGRFIYGLVPATGGKIDELGALLGRWERLKAKVEPLLAHVTNPERVKRIFDWATAPPKARLLPVVVVLVPFDWLLTNVRVVAVKTLFKDRSEYADFKDSIRRMGRLRTQVGFYKGLKRLLSGWRIFHAVTASFLVVMIAAHIALEMYLGYWWIFRK